MSTNRPNSEGVVIEAPMSFTGAAKRVRRMNDSVSNPTVRNFVVAPLNYMFTLPMWWLMIGAWYITFGLLVVPWRLMRRSSRAQKRDTHRHDEMINAIRQSK